METDDVIKHDLKQFILEEFSPRGGSLGDDESLFDAGIIDSLGMIKLVAFIERKFDVTVNPTEVRMQSFDTVNKIVQFIFKKREHND